MMPLPAQRSTATAREPLRLIAVAAFLCVATAGCIGFFRPATPQAPESSSVNITLNYGDPDATLATMAAGIAAKGLGNGKAAYIGAFADSSVDGVPFHATFDPQIAAQHPNVPNWNLELEKNFYSDFIGLRPRDGYRMRWSEADAPGDEIDVLTGEAELYRKYEVFTVDEGGETLDRIAIGIAHLFYKRFSTRWAIFSWEDQVDPTIGPNPADGDDLSMSARRLGT